MDYSICLIPIMRQIQKSFLFGSHRFLTEKTPFSNLENTVFSNRKQRFLPKKTLF